VTLARRVANLVPLNNAKGLVQTKWGIWLAVRQARRSCQSHPAAVRICWDLDNTLADSGSLIRLGKSMQDAVREAEPVRNMLVFFEGMRTAFPDAEHFVLTARVRSMRPDTLAWLRRHGVASRDSAVCFVPHAEAKPRVWRQLARGARLVIIDDLSFEHEAEQPRVYDDLVASAKRTACAYIGIDQIAEIAKTSQAAESAVARLAQVLSA
jgi:hypothetical protein